MLGLTLVAGYKPHVRVALAHVRVALNKVAG